MNLYIRYYIVVPIVKFVNNRYNNEKEGGYFRMSKLISEVEYLEFKGKFRRVLIYTLIGFSVGLGIGTYFEAGWFASLVFGVLLAGMPYAWSVIPFGVAGIIAIIIKLLMAIFLGWIITPIAFIYHFIQMKRYERFLIQHTRMENDS